MYQIANPIIIFEGFKNLPINGNKFERYIAQEDIIMKSSRTITLNGNAQTLTGTELKVGDRAPDFELVDINMKSYRFKGADGKAYILSVVSSLDTAVCDRETRRFNQEAAKLGPNVEILTISRDLPFAQRRWCGAAGVDRVKVLSDYQEAAFGKTYGVLINESKLLARVIFVIDGKGIIRYIQVVPEISQEPDYDAVLEATRKLL